MTPSACAGFSLKGVESEPLAVLGCLRRWTESLPSRGKACRAGRPSCAAGVFEVQAAEQRQTCGELSVPHPKGLEENADTLVTAPQTECCSAGGPSGPERGHTDAQPSSALHSPHVCFPGMARCFQKLQVSPSAVLLLCNVLFPAEPLGAPECSHAPVTHHPALPSVCVRHLQSASVCFLGLTCLLSIESVRPWPRI